MDREWRRGVRAEVRAVVVMGKGGLGKTGTEGASMALSPTRAHRRDGACTGTSAADRRRAFTKSRAVNAGPRIIA